MKLYLLIPVLILVLISGCVHTGEVINNASDVSEANQSETVSQESPEEPEGLCEGMFCGETITTCPDGFVSSCTNPCDNETGDCVPCKPDCTGHAVNTKSEIQTTHECDLECASVCGVLDEEKCTCNAVLFCDGNGICEEGEYPESGDCPECDDGDPCTEDGYDYALGSCVYGEITPCCGNLECESGEDESGCPGDCLREQKGDVKIIQINYDAPGDDKLKENWNGEWVELEGYNIDMTGWTLEDDGGHVYTFPVFLIDGKVRLHSGDGEDNETDLYWNGGRRPIWNNDGDTAVLKDSNGETADSYSY